VTTIAPRADALERRAARVRAPLLAIGGLTTATAALHFRDPHVSGSWGFCPTSLMGLYCPGCGGLRAVNDLTNADVAGAASSNLVLVVIAPFVVLGLLVWLVDSWRGVRREVAWRSVPWPLYSLGITLIVAFTISRNFAFGAWLAP
jgi:hypothetical protein